MQKRQLKRVALRKAALFFIFMFLGGFFPLFSYYNYYFESQEELDYAYESGDILYDIYQDMKDEFKFLRDMNMPSSPISAKELYFKLRGKVVIKSEDYIEKNNDIIAYLKTRIQFARFEVGLLGMHKNDLKTHYNARIKKIIYDDVKKESRLEKYYFQYTAKNTKIIAGNFKAHFGLGLTLSRSNSRKNSLVGETNLPGKRSFIYKNTIYKNYLSNLFLYGFGLEQKYHNFKLQTFYSDLKNPLDNIDVLGFDGKPKEVTVAALDHERLWGNCLEYNYLDIIRVGAIYYQLKNDYLFDIEQSFTKEQVGIYLKVLLNQFYYDQENSEDAFINRFGFNNKDIKFEVFYRKYPENYDNPLANSLSLHADKKYYRCNDEEGIRSSFSCLIKERVKFFLRGDIFFYTKRRENQQTVFYPRIINKYYTTKLALLNDRIVHEVSYNIYDRDARNTSSKYYQRKDAYFNYKLNFKDPFINFYIKYAQRTKGVDVVDYKYTSEYLSFMFKLKYMKGSYLSSQINFKDYHLDDRTEDKYSYIFKLVQRLNKKYKLKFSWYALDLIEEVESEEVGFEWNVKSLQDKWKLELEFII
ncbi:MAG: hypothetical protein GY817_00930 [bacterium]|nr:hypothetical protein [bacterium]